VILLTNFTSTFAIASDGSGLRELPKPLRDAQQIAVASNGRDVAFTRVSPGPPTTTTLALTSLRGGRVRVLRRDRGEIFSPSWSPDRPQILYARDDGRRAELRIVDTAGRHDRRLAAASPCPCATPAWAPDGSGISYIGRDANLYFIGRGPHARRLTSGGDVVGTYSWSPDATEIVYTGWADRMAPDASKYLNTDLYALRRDGRPTSRFIGNDDPRQAESSPVWSPDGTLIAFARRFGVNPRACGVGVGCPRDFFTYVARADGRRERRLSAREGFVPVAWQPR
jgi:Tol biopolymer transport system component